VVRLEVLVGLARGLAERKSKYGTIDYDGGDLLAVPLGKGRRSGGRLITEGVVSLPPGGGGKKDRVRSPKKVDG